MTEKELKTKSKNLASETKDMILDGIKKDLKLDDLMEKVNQIAEDNKKFLDKASKSNVYKIYTAEDASKDIEEADQKELAKAFTYAVFGHDYKAVDRICRKSYDLLSDSRKKGLTGATDASGGYLVPEEFYNQLIVERDNTLQLRNQVTVWQMRYRQVNIPTQGTSVVTSWGTEGGTKTTTTMTFGEKVLYARKLFGVLRITDELLDDSVINIQQYIVSEFSRRLREAEEKAILVGAGSGSNQPDGLFPDANIGATASTSFGFDEIKTLFHSLPSQYRARAKWLVSDTVFEKIDKLKDGNNRYLLQDSVADGTPPRMQGKEVIVVPDEYMTGYVNQMMFADLKDTYVLGDKHEMRLLVSQHEQGSFLTDRTAYRVVMRLGGIVVQPKAAKKLTGIS